MADDTMQELLVVNREIQEHSMNQMLGLINMLDDNATALSYLEFAASAVRSALTRIEEKASELQTELDQAA